MKLEDTDQIVRGLHADEPVFPTLDEPMPPPKHQTDALPLPEWNRAVAMAQWLRDQDTVSPLRRRMASYLEATGHGRRRPL